MAIDWGQVISAGIGAGAGLLGEGDQEVTTKPNYLPGQKNMLENFLLNSQQQFLQGPQQYYPGQTLAQLDPLTIAGQNMALDRVGAQSELAQMGAGAMANLLHGGSQVGGFQLPSQIGWGVDPGLQAAVTNPIYRQLEERILPGLDLQATAQGAFGGTRQALMKGQAAANATEQATDALARANLAARQQTIGQRAGDISAQLQGRQQDIAQNQYGAGNMLSALGMIPSYNAALMAPSQTLQDVGRARTLYEQAQLDADRARWDFGQQAAYDAVDRLGARLMLPQTGSSQIYQGSSGSPANILGGALSGLSLYNMFNSANAQPSYTSQIGAPQTNWLTPNTNSYMQSIGAF